MPDNTTSPSGQEPPQTGQAPTGQQTDPTNGNGSPEPRVFDEEYVKTLRGEAAKHRTELQKAREELQKLQDRDLTDQQRLQKERDELSQQLGPLQTKLARYEVAAEAGLPLDLAARLQGSTREELASDADALKRQFGIGGDGQEPENQTDFDAGVRRSTGGRAKGVNGLIFDLARSSR